MVVSPVSYTHLDVYKRQPLYGNKSKLIDRVALHAYKLEFIHPVTKQQIIVKADLPQDMNFINIKKDWL